MPLFEFCLRSFTSAESDKSVQNLLEVSWRLLLWSFYKLECTISSFIVTIHHDNKKICTSLAWSPYERSLRQSRNKWIISLDCPRFLLGIELRLVTAAVDSILRLTRVPADSVLLLNTSLGWFYPTADSNSSRSIRVAVDSILQLTQVLAAGYKLRLILSYG